MKFIKLTRFDNQPVWLNASFIVTVEPRRGGVGSVVVPIGDGLDYDVRESPDEVLRMLDDAPAPAVVPVPVSDGLAPTPPDVSPEPQPRREEPPKDEPKAESPAEEPKKPRKRVAKAKKPAAKKPAKKDEVAPPAVAPLELPDDQIVRLTKLAPKSLGKLKNTLLTQFHVADVSATVQGLVAKGVFALEETRVVWPPKATDENAV